MEINTFKLLLKKLSDGVMLTPDETNELDSIAVTLSDMMKEGTIDPESQEALDYYVDYYKATIDKRAITDGIINKYDETVEMQNVKENTNENKLDKPKVLTLKPLEDNSGAIKAITIIYVAILLALLIAFVLFYLKYKV